MLHDHHAAIAATVDAIRRRLTAERGATRRTGRFTPAEHPRSRGPTPNPRRP